MLLYTIYSLVLPNISAKYSVLIQLFLVVPNIFFFNFMAKNEPIPVIFFFFLPVHVYHRLVHFVLQTLAVMNGVLKVAASD